MYLNHKTKQVVFDNSGESRSREQKMSMIGQGEAKTPLVERAEEVQANLSAKFPSFVKRMLRSHVTTGFLLSLPKPFCDVHLPGNESTVMLVDTNEEEYRVKYLVEKAALSAGWGTFSLAHNLIEGDVSVFQLVRRCEFKVYILRTKASDDVDGALSLLHLHAHARRTNFEKPDRTLQKTEGKDLEPPSPYNVQEIIQRSSQMVSNTNPGPLIDRSENGVENIGLVLEVTKVLGSFRSLP